MKTVDVDTCRPLLSETSYVNLCSPILSIWRGSQRCVFIYRPRTVFIYRPRTRHAPGGVCKGHGVCPNIGVAAHTSQTDADDSSWRP
jgi:hypothetical protein